MWGSRGCGRRGGRAGEVGEEVVEGGGEAAERWGELRARVARVRDAEERRGVPSTVGGDEEDAPSLLRGRGGERRGDRRLADPAFSGNDEELSCRERKEAGTAVHARSFSRGRDIPR